MFIEIKKKGRSIQYYLVHTLRENKKVVKISRYIGSNLSEKKLFEKRIKAENYLKDQIRLYREIRDPLKNILSEEELRQIKNLETKIDFKIDHLTDKQWLRFSELFSYNTNAIEGSTLTLKEVSNILESKKPTDKNQNDIEEAKGVAEAIKYIRKTKTHLSLDLLKKLHSLVFQKTKPFAGRFRAFRVEVGIRDAYGNIIHRGALSQQVVYLLEELVDWYNLNKNKYSPILLAAVVHNQFENIHPFQDGNGRVGRLILNNILLKHKMPPVDIEFEKRQEYYHALQAYEHQGNIRPTIELIIKEYNNLKKKIKNK